MDYQKELMEILKIRKSEKVRRTITINDSEELRKAIFKLIKSELRNHVRADLKVPFDITIDITEDNRLSYALAKSEDDPDIWYYFGTGSSKMVLEREILYEICENINKENISDISAHISNVFENLVISIN